MLFKSKYYSVDYRYKDFKEKNDCAPYKEPDVRKRGNKYNTVKSFVDELIEKIIKDKKCSLYDSLLEEFLRRKNSTESLYDKKYDIRQELADLGTFDEEIQANFAFRGWTSALCSVSHVTERNKGSITQIVSENDQQISHCGNVKAVSSSNGNTAFFIAEATSHHSLGKAHTSQNDGNTLEVETVTLKSFCEEKSIKTIDILKVDVEGFELEIFQGSENLFKEKSINNLIFEISLGVMKRLNRDPLELIHFLESHNYMITNAFDEIITSKDISNLDGQDLLARPN
ncbi:MAG: FkbM family methyltransferase [Bacteriovoracaceae bacterium]|jgi:FkbM family methyltransferase|nr:FkbM family methyltransferase [Bacteriovoracaceae bacterium]